jgi:hypothetical protein
MGQDNFEDRTTFEKRFCKVCCSETEHRVLSRWGAPPDIEKMQKIPPEQWKYEREVAAHCKTCFPYAIP